MKINEEKQKIVYDNFLKIISLNNPTYLTTRGFNSVSEYSTIATCKIMRIKWLDLLEGIGKKQVLLDYIVNEFRNFYNETKLASFAEFLKSHKYITYDLAYPFGFKTIKKLCGFNRSNIYTKEELINKYNEVKEQIGYVPSRAEFESINEIDLKIFNNVFELNTTKWEVLLEALGESKQNIQELRNRLKVRNINIAKKANKASKDKIGILTEEQLEVEFKRTFDGAQHRRPFVNMGGQKDFERRQIADVIKNNLLKEHRINLLRIDSRSDWKNADYLKSLLTEYI